MESLNQFDTLCLNSDFADDLYQKFLKDKNSVPADWALVFNSIDIPKNNSIRQESFSTEDPVNFKVHELIKAYQDFGFESVEVNPLVEGKKREVAELDLKNFSLNGSDLNKSFMTFGLLDTPKATLSQILERLNECFSGRIGFEIPTTARPDLRKWLFEKILKGNDLYQLTLENKKKIFEELTKSELLEVFLHNKFTGQKRFSLEGAETLIPILSSMIDVAAEEGVSEIYLGMAHRGRLNVLSNILKKKHKDLFAEFEEGYFPDSFEGTGDVKYHKGFLSEVQTVHGKKIKITLSPNASHLESAGAIIEGEVRARQTALKDDSRKKVVPILVHGDAAISGQGVVYETLQMNALQGYTTGGTIHIIVNNQVGFTATPEEGRSTKYCTDIAKAFGFPVFHLNGEDPESSVVAAMLAFLIRQKFHVDVFLDLNCYRKWGHNESDEPAYTQPKEVKTIKVKKSVKDLYLEKLINEGVIDRSYAERFIEEFKALLQEGKLAVNVQGFKNQLSENEKNAKEEINTNVQKVSLKAVGEALKSVPKEFKIHPKLENLIKARNQMVSEDGVNVDYGMGEMLAYGTLLQEGVSLRLAGQDSQRGTFSHRHAVYIDQENGNRYSPLSTINSSTYVEIINSYLSEYAALGFEYGFSIEADKTLVIWEAQFGDFANGAQILIDQYLAAGEQKWGQKSSLTLLLPHGYEGQGPEHSSARIERFLSLAAANNLLICNPTTPAQIFHLLRLQGKKKEKCPLICFTPKSLLREPLCQSPLEDFTEGRFQKVIDDPLKPIHAKKVYFCSGKVFYELLSWRKKEGRDDLAFIRIEELYPFPEKEIQKVLSIYKNVTDVFYFQEEPKNMGAYSFMAPLLEGILPNNISLKYIGRKSAAAPATGSHDLHNLELKEIFDQLKQQDTLEKAVK